MFNKCQFCMVILNALHIIFFKSLSTSCTYIVYLGSFSCKLLKKLVFELLLVFIFIGEVCIIEYCEIFDTRKPFGRCLVQTFLLCGRLIFGPDARSLFVTITLILVPAIIFCVFVARHFLAYYVQHRGYAIMVITVVYTSYVSTTTVFFEFY